MHLGEARRVEGHDLAVEVRKPDLRRAGHRLEDALVAEGKRLPRLTPNATHTAKTVAAATTTARSFEPATSAGASATSVAESLRRPRRLLK